MKIAMYGSGAAGSVFASYLKKGGADMILIDRYEAHMKKVAEDGMHFTIHQEENGAYTDYNYQLKGFRTYTSSAAAEEAEGKVDVIIYMTLSLIHIFQARESRQGVVAAVGYRLFPNEGADILFKACKAAAVAEALFKRLAGPFGKRIVFRGSEAHYNAAFGL